MVSYCLAKYGGHRHCGSEQIMILVFLVILEDHHLSKSRVNLWATAHQGKLPFYGFGGHRDCGSEEIMILICHVITRTRDQRVT